MKATPGSPPPPPRKRSSGLLKWIAFLVTVIGGGVLGVIIFQRSLQPHVPFSLPNLPASVVPQQPMRVERPYGMHPVAFGAYIRACNNAGIHPYRVGQTIGNHPRSVGYHKRDATLWYRGQRVEYCAAVDLGTNDLDNARINRFLRTLAVQGFAAWYRHGPRWRNGEHIHAVYALLPMKSQLRGQVDQFLAERRASGKRPYKWERKLRVLRRKWRRMGR